MHFLQRLRQASHITRFMLVWFVLSLGAAVASPLINPQPMELICASNGVMKVLVKNADGSTTEEAQRMLDCPLCGAGAALPPVAQTMVPPAQPPAHALQPIPAARIAAQTATPPPARAPPVHA